jgi:hypothetical protein
MKVCVCSAGAGNDCVMPSITLMVQERSYSVYLEQGIKKLASCPVERTQDVKDRLELWV